MAAFTVKMKHSEQSLTALAHMQYDLFCQRNRFVRTIVAAAAVVAGVYLAPRSWAYYLLVAYGCYLLTSTYASANHTASKTVAAIKASGMDFPSSRYEFEENKMRVFALPDNEELSSLSYSAVRELGSDMKYYYIFRDEVGGYMIPYTQLGDRRDEFHKFIEKKTGKSFRTRRAPVSRLIESISRRNDEPYHL